MNKIPSRIKVMKEVKKIYPSYNLIQRKKVVKSIFNIYHKNWAKK